MQIAASPKTCPANIGKGYGDDWEGEFFPGIPKIKYESLSSKSPLAFKWDNAEEEILGKKMSVFPFSLLSLSPLSQLLLLFLLLRWCLFLGKILGFLLFNLSQEKDILTTPIEEKEQKALYYAIVGFMEKWWNGSDLYPDPCVITGGLDSKLVMWDFSKGSPQKLVDFGVPDTDSGGSAGQCLNLAFVHAIVVPEVDMEDRLGKVCVVAKGDGVVVVIDIESKLDPYFKC